ncbi:Crp/Fnr family transcriptional regulator [Desulfurobacterium sp.]|uniref:Crp/Fnr family transcriptional regulator n=1 Tax=Desulfurobacterium sp. TaxID=2004706 RepID=UPI0026165D52|nr:Crp/Fnr family transcriptional regulator [Desulfurobacterium sp.]
MHVLKSLPPFSTLTDLEIRKIENVLIYRRYHRGQVLFSSYDEANGIYILTYGKVKLYKSFGGKEQTLRIFAPVSMIGEAGALKGGNFPANAVALEDTEVLFLHRKELTNIIKNNPDIAMKMIGILSERLFHLVSLVENLSLKDAVSRVYDYIVHKADESGRLEFKTTIVAMELGLTVETVSRAVSQLKKRGKIRKTGKIVELI